MARHTGPVCKLCRNEEKKLFLKGTRCYSNKCSVAKRPYGSGQHGQSRKKLSEYAVHLREKQSVRRRYLVLEKQFSKYYQNAARKKGVTGTILLQFLEMRFDSIVSLAGLTLGRKQARQLIKHGHFLINGRKVDIPSFRLKPGDEISVKEGSKQLIKDLSESATISVEPRWLSVDKQSLKVQVSAVPEREDIDPTIKEHLIIEYYSK